MQTDWLIDFMTLAQTRSFSRAAELRHVTQPAFSRRIQALEAWATVALVNRSCHPPTLTAAGELLCAESPAIVASVLRTHATLRARAQTRQDVLTFGCTHTLAFSFFTRWLCENSKSLGSTKTRLTALDPAEAMQRLDEGECDLLLTYGVARGSEALHTARFDTLPLGRDRLIPCSRPDARGRPMHVWPGTGRPPVHYLGHASNSELASVIERASSTHAQDLNRHRVFESDSTESLKAMAVAGRGVAILPEHCVLNELACTTLVPAGEPLQTSLEILLVRKRAAHPMGAQPLRDALWAALSATPRPQELAETV
ncbi:LysR family transcriptional regulator [Hydrogenophaga sp.]|uniref:LysR family transcriptional regulator n=1 Tax=Hydrogenophaga sp. TaxID=1904254 RepID=UPI003F72F2BC